LSDLPQVGSSDRQCRRHDRQILSKLEIEKKIAWNFYLILILLRLKFYANSQTLPISQILTIFLLNKFVPLFFCFIKTSTKSLEIIYIYTFGYTILYSLKKKLKKKCKKRSYFHFINFKNGKNHINFFFFFNIQAK
jgi:hypothetical protein